MKSSTKRFAIGTLIALSAGYIIGILTAPKSGRETRRDIKDTAARGFTAAEKQLKQLHTQLVELLAQAKVQAGKATGKSKEQLDAAIENAKIAKEKVRIILSAIHEGDAEDEDLKKAVNEANEAVKHLKTYLGKPV